MRWCVLLCVLAVSAAHADDYYVLPFDVDPAVVADGDLSDWGNIPNAITIKDKANVTYGPDMWSGPEDLSVTYHLAWRPGMIAVAAEVTDSSFLQPFVGRDIWKGDHINLWMDFTPGVDPQRTMFGEGQFHFVISPGNFGTNPPEIYVYRPEGQNPGPGQVAAKRTDTGYIVEAVIPVERLKIDAISMNKDANFEIAVSDADSDPAKQETFITYGPEKWIYSRNRVLPMVFGDGNGKAPPPQRGETLIEHHEIPGAKSHTVTFKADAIPDDKQPFIFLKARYPTKKIGGWRSNALSLELNGERVTGDRINNRPAKATVMSGKQGTFITPRWADGRLLHTQVRLSRHSPRPLRHARRHRPRPSTSSASPACSPKARTSSPLQTTSPRRRTIRSSYTWTMWSFASRPRCRRLRRRSPRPPGKSPGSRRNAPSPRCTAT